jgi:hypothetical protein
MVELLEVNVEDFTVKPSAFTLEIEPFKSIVKRDKGSKGDSQGRNKLEWKFAIHLIAKKFVLTK